MNVWEGLGSSIVSATVGAVVAVLVVHLSNVSARRSWYQQRRIEAFERVLDALNQCWRVTWRNWDDYPLPNVPSWRHHRLMLWIEHKLTKPLEKIPPGTREVMMNRDRDLLAAYEQARVAIDLWALYLDNRAGEIEHATRRGLDVLYGEWDYSSYEARGGLYIPIDETFVEEWTSYVKSTREWHRATGRRKKPFDRQLAGSWQQTPKTKEDILNDFPEDIRFSVE